MNLTEMRAQRETLANQMRQILTSPGAGAGLTDAQGREFDSLKGKVDALDSTLKRAALLGELRSEIERPITGAAAIATEGGMSYGRRSERPGEVRSLAHNEAVAEAPYVGPQLGVYVRGIVTGRWGGAEELRALAEGSTPGSYLVPTPLSLSVIDVVRNRAAVLAAGALTIPMESSTLKIARQTGDVTAGWKAENAAMTFSDTAFDVVSFTAQTLLAGSKLSIELVEDAANIDAIVTNSISKSLALEIDRVCLYGTGTPPQPRGIKNQSGVTVTDLATNGYTLVDFSKFSTALATLMGSNFTGPFSILYSARTAGELDGLQDTLHQPLRQPDLVAAARKLVTNQIPNNATHGTATTGSDAFVGQFDQCLIGMRTQLMLEISRQAADAGGSAFTNAQIWIRAYLRADVAVAHPLAFNVLTGIL